MPTTLLFEIESSDQVYRANRPKKDSKKAIAPTIRINGKKLQTAQEVGLFDSLPPSLSCALDDLAALVKTFGGIGHGVRCGCVAVVWCRRDVVGVVMGRNLGSNGSGASGEFLLVALPLFLIQGCDRVSPWRPVNDISITTYCSHRRHPYQSSTALMHRPTDPKANLGTPNPPWRRHRACS